MKSILILDVETTGVLPPPKDRVVEIGVVLWSVEHRTTVAQYSSLVEGPANPAHHANHIPESSLSEGAPEASVWERLSPWLARADALVAHQCEFDRRYTPPGWDQGKPWICSMNDIEWPQHSGSKALVAILLQHGLGVTHAHRALTDCQHIARLFERCHEMGFDVRDLLVQGARPKGKFVAKVSYYDRDKAKLSGFRWNGDTKQWIRSMAIEDAGALPFPVERIDVR
jgi:DNA polymerase III subunit epsilon